MTTPEKNPNDEIRTGRPRCAKVATNARAFLHHSWFGFVSSFVLRASDFKPVTFLLAIVFLSGCGGEHIQSVLHPASPEAERVERLWWFLFVVCTLVFLAVLLLLAIAILPGKRSGPPGGPTRFIVISGILVPAVILVVMLVYSLRVTIALKRPDVGVRIVVVGHQFWWEIQYPDHGFTIANELYIPAGEPVLLELVSADVIHSFWVPNLHGKMDMLPGHTNRFWLRSDHPGVFRGQCAEFCGVQHARMAFKTVALSPDEFDQWIARRQQPQPPPASPLLQRGQKVFFDSGCANCHAIHGTEATARVGPDLSDMGGRLTIGAGQFPNNHGNLSGWIVNPQALKPGNLMPRTFLEANELHALVAYLQSLE
jgi:cytochrome c oxidase subunit II